MTNAARHLRLVTDADVPPAQPPAPAPAATIACPVCRTSPCAHWPNGVPLAAPNHDPFTFPPSEPFDFAANIAPPQEHRRRCVYRTAGELRRRRAAAARRLRRRKSQRPLRLGAARKGVRWSRAHSSTRIRLTPDEQRDLAATSRSLASLYADRPRVLDDCETQGYVVRGAGPVKPCPWASCRHTLLIEVKPPSGHMVRPSLKVNFPGRDFDELDETCSLRLPLRGEELSLEAVGKLMNVHMERVRQIEEIALAKGKEQVDDDAD